MRRDDDDDVEDDTAEILHKPTYTTHSRTLTRVTKFNFLLQLIYFEMCEIRTINMYAESTDYFLKREKTKKKRKKNELKKNEI